MNITELLYCCIAITEEMIINTTTSERIVRSWPFSLNFFIIFPLKKSSVSVDDEARTNAESVDIEADRTRMTVMPISMGDRFDSMLGIIESKPFAATASAVVCILPKAPRKYAPPAMTIAKNVDIIVPLCIAFSDSMAYKTSAPSGEAPTCPGR